VHIFLVAVNFQKSRATLFLVIVTTGYPIICMRKEAQVKVTVKIDGSSGAYAEGVWGFNPPIGQVKKLWPNNFRSLSSGK